MRRCYLDEELDPEYIDELCELCTKEAGSKSVRWVDIECDESLTSYEDGCSADCDEELLSNEENEKMLQIARGERKKRWVLKNLLFSIRVHKLELQVHKLK